MKKLFFSVVLSLIAGLSFSQERITNFDVTLTLNEKAELTVTEKITVNAEHKKIRRGIYRTIPLEADRDIIPLSLYMDGEPHPYFTERYNGDLTINFGNDDYIARGPHEYTLTYIMKNGVIFNGKYDEIYWNVTGNYWQFPIERASFKFIAPKGLKVIDEGISLYTGRYGEKQSLARTDGNLFFYTTSILGPGEGFTVAVPFEKGFVKESLQNKLKRFARKHLPWLLFAVLLIYFLFTWYKYGRDPKYDGRVLYAPPEGISPAFAGYLLERKFKLSFFAAALVSLCGKEKIKITGSGKLIELKRQDKYGPNLPKEELFILDTFFSSDVVYIGKSYQPEIAKSVNAFRNILKSDGRHFINKNNKFGIFPILIMLAMQTAFEPQIILINVILTMTAFSIGVKNTLHSNWPTLIILIFFLPTMNILFNSKELIFLSSIAGYLVYMSTIDNTTKAGRDLYLDLLGFKKYMETAETHRAELSNPEDKLKVFADYLPYAYAFGVQGEWIKSFTKMLSKDIVEEKLMHYGGRPVITGSILSRGLARTSIKPSSKSSGGGGSFGGGFSGGGFGGGGGGGR